jgi:hypothetical protein
MRVNSPGPELDPELGPALGAGVGAGAAGALENGAAVAGGKFCVGALGAVTRGVGAPEPATGAFPASG